MGRARAERGGEAAATQRVTPAPARPSPAGGPVPMGLDFAAFVPGAGDGHGPPAPPLDEAAILARLSDHHGTVSGGAS
jgi:hypothetical protein